MAKKRKNNIVWDGRSPFEVTLEDAYQTLANAKRWHEDQFRAGEIVNCKCCGQVVKAYPRGIYQRMVMVLAYLYKYGAMTPADIAARAKSPGGDYHKLTDWGLIVRIEGQDEEPTRYAITQRGRDFLMGRIMVAKALAIYNGEVWGATIEQVNVEDCLKKDFSIQEILNPLNIRGYEYGGEDPDLFSGD